MEKRIFPDFKSEAEEAKWWFDHQDEVFEDLDPAVPACVRCGRSVGAVESKLNDTR